MGNTFCHLNEYETTSSAKERPVDRDLVDHVMALVSRKGDIENHNGNKVHNKNSHKGFEVVSQSFNTFNYHDRNLPISWVKNRGKIPSATDIKAARTRGTTMVTGASLMFALVQRPFLPWKKAL